MLLSDLSEAAKFSESSFRRAVLVENDRYAEHLEQGWTRRRRAARATRCAIEYYLL
jgi:hypothetical protein